jgi:hypothetical protein
MVAAAAVAAAAVVVLESSSAPRIAKSRVAALSTLKIETTTRSH